MNEGPIVLKGAAASPGIALGYVHVLERGRSTVPRKSVSRPAIESEIKRFDEALDSAREHLHRIRKKVSEEQGDDHVYLIEAQLMMLDDRSLTDDTRDIIREQLVNAEWALQRAVERFKKAFDKIDDEYFRDRRSDIEYVEERLLRALKHEKEPGFVSLQRQTVIVSHDLSPADLSKLNRENICGVATDAGGRTSHISIIARSLGIPSVVGLQDLSLYVSSGDRIVVDGSEGAVVIRPDAKTWAEYEFQRKQFLSERKELLKNRNHKAETLDQYEMHLLANIDLVEELPSVVSNGAEGIGILRTEHFFLGGSIPVSEEEQFQSYRKVAQRLKNRETVIRLLDVAGDSLFFAPLMNRQEHNPALGLRGIRLLLRETDLFRTQVRAILRASAFGKVAILYPMVSKPDEVRAANALVREEMARLEKVGIRFDPDLRIGTMIETPAAALIADRLAQEVDFLSVGTNDLTQYTLGVDRTNELVSHLFEPFHPAILRLLKMVVEAAHKAGIEAGVCGEVSADPMYIPLLLGLEFNFLSMTAGSIPMVKQVIRELTLSESKRLVGELLVLGDATEVRARLSARYPSRFRTISA